jgi:hypothetical protein
MTKTPLLIVSTFWLALAACGNGDPPLADAGDVPAGPPRAVVVAGNFMPGNPGVLTTLDPATRTVMTNVGPALAVGEDPILRHFGNELFIVNRAGGNNVTILDAQTLQLEEQLGTGAGNNAQDVAVLGPKLYVATFSGTGLIMLTRGSTTPTPIALPADDPDGTPNCNSVYMVGSNLYVSCGLLDDTKAFVPRGPGKVYVVDTATSAIKTTLTLGHANPFGVFEQIPASAPHGGGELLMPTVLFSDPNTGCVERITTGPTPAAAGCFVDNTVLGGYASRIAFQIDGGAAFAWIAVPTTFPNADLRVFDMAIDLPWPGAFNAAGQAIGDVVACPSGELVVTDTTMDANGLRVYSGAAEVTTAPLPIGLPPSSTHGLACY